MSAACSTGYVSRPVPVVSTCSDLDLYCVIRLSQPVGVTQVRIHASSAWAGTSDCRKMIDWAGSMPQATYKAAT